MKPVSYQSMPSSMNGGHPNLPLERLLTTSKVMYCEKCRFASMDPAQFKKHMIEHMGPPFYCVSCNYVSVSEAELNEHMKQHKSDYPFKCPHCGQGYMRRLCLVKHIDRLHSKVINQGPPKLGMTKSPQVPVSSALTSVSAADPSPLRPLVRVTVPTSSASDVRLGKDEQRVKTLDTTVINATNGNAELLSPLNGLIHHNRALTVSLPEEVTIPAGCLVEFVEVKTVNGTKELRLRLVSQQENTSVIKDTRTAFSQTTALGKRLSSTLNQPNTVRSTSMGMCTINRKQCETKAVNVEHPVPASISSNIPNVASKDKSGLKRASPEIINLECNTVIPNKVPKCMLNPVREGSSGIRVTQTAAPISIRGPSRLNTTLHSDNMGTSVCPRVVDDRKILIPEHLKSTAPRRVTDAKNSPRDVSMALKVEPRAICLKTNTVSKTMKETVSLNQQRFKSASPSFSVPKARPPAILVNKNNAANQSFPQSRTLNKPLTVNIPVLSKHTKSKVTTWTQDVTSNDTAREVSEPKSFPIISSVFSLSQQPEDAQGSMQPLVMALRGIVMDKSNSSGSAPPDPVKITNSADQANKTPTAGLATKKRSFIRDLLLTDCTSESVKVEEQDKSSVTSPQPNHIDVKKEKGSTAATSINKSPPVPALKPSTDEEPKIASHVETPATADPLQQVDKNELDIPSKFLTVSLKRVQVGVWKKNNKGLKLRISKYKTQVPMGSVTDCAVIYPMPLKVDQLVKRPGPNQPVVVLNHPKPRVSVQGTKAETFANTGASEVVPKCQILKMRLSKVMGQKYEVMGCTVRVFP
ncbi:uncharacterized protein LOC125007809 [Mugil cephalus]|uniref:uncharacterized protein LOC125007809 n=1 Tax=Mugil cephalus TaxID=48193 RepID=UPI001FB73FBF|nr:uncharacterized protein LOC125007809 [Mugil cephalus]